MLHNMILYYAQVFFLYFFCPCCWRRGGCLGRGGPACRWRGEGVPTTRSILHHLVAETSRF